MRYQVLAIAAMRRRLTLAMVDPFNILAADDIHEITGLDIAPVLCTHDDFCQRFEAFYSFKVAIEEIAGEALDPVPGISFAARQPQEIDLNEVLAASGSSSVIRTVNCMLRHAVMVRASDIHIEPQSKTTSLRFRVDGVLQEESPPPFQMHNAIVSRIKVMSEMDIAERRRPQDGRFRAQVEGREIDFRVSCLPTGYGEKIVIRVLDTLALKGFSLDTLGFHARGLEEFRRAASAPHGMIIMTGPTGSGKSTSLYMALREINKPGINIVTVVDPIEYEIEGINQVAARPEIGLTFAAGLRSILRQDPNVIMIGEIRDYETAEIAVKAALTSSSPRCTRTTPRARSRGSSIWGWSRTCSPRPCASWRRSGSRGGSAPSAAGRRTYPRMSLAAWSVPAQTSRGRPPCARGPAAPPACTPASAEGSRSSRR